MTLTIGRFTTSRDPANVNFDGDNLSLNGMLFAGNFDYLDVLRQQLLGLDGNEDEPDVPVTWSTDDAVNGYYTVRSVTVTPIRAVTYNNFKFNWSAQLERIGGGFAVPLCEVSTPVVLRTNSVGVTAPGGRIGIPSASAFQSARYFDARFAPFAGVNRVTATGDVALAEGLVAGVFESISYSVLPGDYYDGSALIEQSVGGVWSPVVGDQIGSVAGNLLRVGNGLLRLTFHTDGVITSEIFDGTVWESNTSFGVYRNSTQLWTATGYWKILRNSPAVCTIVNSVQSTGSGSTYAEKLTISVERGKMLAELSTDNLFYQRIGTTIDTPMQLRAATNTAATAITGGIRQTSNNAEGHRWLMTSPSTLTTDLVNGRIAIGAPGAPLVGQFGLGWELNGSASSGDFTAANVADHYFTVTGPVQRVVSR